MLLKLSMVFNFLVCFVALQGQKHFTPYDELPGIHKSFKPLLQNDAPSWAAMMYQYPINFFDLQKQFEHFQKERPTKNPYSRYFKHWSRIILPLVQEDGSILMPDNTKINKLLLASRNRPQRFTGRNESPWTFLGPQVTHWLKEDNNAEIPAACPWQVNIYSLDISRTNNQVLYCGTETGAINKSIDSGLTWELVTRDYFTGGGVNSVAIHPSNADIVYAAAGNQVHKTEDGGLTWRPLLTNLFFDANTLKISDDGLKIMASSSNGIFISTNEGVSWRRTLNINAYDIEFKPNDQNIVYVLASQNQFFTVFQSTDGGENFGLVSAFPSDYKDAAGGVLAVTKANPNILMMTLLSSNETPIVIRGDFDNNNWLWTEISRGKSSKLRMDNGQGYYDLDMEISPVDEAKFVVATTTMYKTQNGGNSFTPVGGYEGNFPIHPDIQDVKFTDEGVLWVATDGGLSMSTDFFVKLSAFFVRTNGIIGSDFWGFDQGWNEDIVVGGRYHNGNTAIADFYQPKALRMGGAESPTGWVVQGKSRHVAFDDLGGGWVLPSKAEDIYEGRFLFTKFPNMDEYGGRRGSVLHHPYYYSHLYLGEGNGLWQSQDAGASWDLLYQFPGRVMQVVIGVQEPNIMYADIVGQGLFRSEDGGLSWTKRPSLTSTPNGSSHWNGKLSLAISPYNADIIYACLQNGTWSADKGAIFKSADGGKTWQNITFGLDVYMKSVVVQPSGNRNDLVYLFTNAKNNLQAEVWVLEASSVNWQNYSASYPAGMSVNHVIPFYKGDKIRVAGNLGVWEANLYHKNYQPIIRPWAEKQLVPCTKDTISLDDHSIITHQNISWSWIIDPAPQYISSSSVRKPKLVFGKEGKYSVTLRIEINGQFYEKKIEDMIEVKKCPSVETCDNPGILFKQLLKVKDFDSEEVNDPGKAIMAIDNNLGTIWHTKWSTGSDDYPHFIDIDLGRLYKLNEFIYLPRQDGSENGRVKDFELFISQDGDDWGQAVVTSSFENNAAPKKVKLDVEKPTRFVRFKALSEVNGNPWASAAELDFVGCYAEVSNADQPLYKEVNAYPIPAMDKLLISLPQGRYTYFVYQTSGLLQSQGVCTTDLASASLDVSSYSSGIYHIVAVSERGIQFRLKFIKL